MLKGIRNFLHGLVLGITQVIPGVSGATIAIILGVYFEIIEAINHFTKDFRKHSKFVFPLVFGLVCGILLFSSIVNFLLANYSFPTMLFFIGLIAGIIPHLYTKLKEGGRKLKGADILLIAVPFLILLAVSGLRGESITDPGEAIDNIGVPYMVFIFFAGILAAASLIIPGFSGSFVMLLLGVYPLVIYSISSIRLLLADITNVLLLINICKVLVPLGIGIIIGGLSMSALIEKLLKNHTRTVYSIILGLLFGSVLVLFREPMVYRSGLSTLHIIAGILSLSLGCVVSFCLGKERI